MQNNRACTNCSLSAICLPLGLTTNEMQRLETVIDRYRMVKAHEVLVEQGKPFASLFAVRSGSFKAFQVTAGGREQVTNFYLPGELMGFEAIYQRQYQASITALETSTVCEIPFNQLLRLAADMPTLQQQLFNLMSQKMAPQFPVNIQSPAEGRMAAFLLSISARFKKRGFSATTFNLSMSRQDIASFLGMATETVSRLFSHMEEQEILSVNRREITIKNFRLLQKMVCGAEDSSE